MHLSYSQITTYLDCPRRWWFEKKSDLPTVNSSDGYIIGKMSHLEGFTQSLHYLVIFFPKIKTESLVSFY
jgi:hypothetical protein